MTPEALAARHPRLYHVTAPGAWEGIARHGLLPARALVDLFGANPAIVEQRRPDSVTLSHPGHGHAVITDNAPLRRAARRGLATFTPMDRHEYDVWRRLRGRLDRVVEVTVVGGVADIGHFVTNRYRMDATQPV